MSIKAEIIADSISPTGFRLTTFVLEYPRFIHAEIMTHRVFSKNAASSRAIPIEKMIEQVETNPAMPVWWGKNQSGMQAKEELDDNNKKEFYFDLGDEWSELIGYDTPKQLAQEVWLKARDEAIVNVRRLNKIGLHKQIANRLLEPWFNIRIILSGTDFDNFFALRAHPDAQPEFQDLAYKMLNVYNASEPKRLKPGDWHIPFGDKIDINKLMQTEAWEQLTSGCAHELSGDTHRFIDELKMKIAIARCARVSYLNYEGKDDYSADIRLCDRLFGSVPRHLSPTEHVAQCTGGYTYIGNFRGWKQYRYTFADQNLTDPRIIRKQWKATS